MGFPNELSWAHPITQEWFVTRFGSPTEPQVVPGVREVPARHLVLLGDHPEASSDSRQAAMAAVR